MRVAPVLLPWLFWFASGCDELSHQVDCRLRRSLDACQKGSNCMPEGRCLAGGNGRCSKDCIPLGGACGLSPSAPLDECIVDVSHPAQGFRCEATDHDPTRCTLTTNPEGRPICVDSRPPCAGCAQTFDHCGARPLHSL